MHDITVWTTILRPDGTVWLADRMQWFGVEDEVRGWLAESCRVTAIDLCGYPQTVGAGWTIRYRTLVEGPSPSDTTEVDFPSIDWPGVVRFQRWALHELTEMLAIFERKHDALPTPTKPRNHVLAALGLLWQWLRNRAG